MPIYNPQVDSACTALVESVHVGDLQWFDRVIGFGLSVYRREFVCIPLDAPKALAVSNPTCNSRETPNLRTLKTLSALIKEVHAFLLRKTSRIFRENFCGHFPWNLKDENLRKKSPIFRRIFRRSLRQISQELRSGGLRAQNFGDLRKWD